MLCLVQQQGISQLELDAYTIKYGDEKQGIVWGSELEVYLRLL